MRTRLPCPWHIPDRVTYDCRRCGAAWPCGLARVRLLGQRWRRGELGVRMAVEMGWAADVLPVGAELYQRFLGWIRTGRAEMERNRSCDSKPKE